MKFNGKRLENATTRNTLLELEERIESRKYKEQMSSFPIPIIPNKNVKGMVLISGTGETERQVVFLNPYDKLYNNPNCMILDDVSEEPIDQEKLKEMTGEIWFNKHFKMPE